MCSNNNGALIPYGIKIPNPATFSQFHSMTGMTQAAFEYHRAQLYDYATRFPYGIRGYPPGTLAYHPHPHDPLTHAFLYKHDPRARFIHEEPKPSHSYIGLIAMGILGSKDHKLVLSDIYQYILDNYAYFRNRGPGWRNSIRHNLSLNDCFIKSGRSANGKGHYWAIHPANFEDFKKGDFRRRRAQRRVRKHMGLSVPDDEDSPSPPPPTSQPWPTPIFSLNNSSDSKESDCSEQTQTTFPANMVLQPPATFPSRKRQFDVESLLAPDDASDLKYSRTSSPSKVVITHRESKDDDSDCDVVNLSKERRHVDTDIEFNGSSDGKKSPDIQVSESETTSRQDSPVDCSVSRRSPNIEVSENGLSRSWHLPGLIWPRDGPSAFHNAGPNTAIAWTTISPHGYPIMTAPYPVHAGTAPTPNAVAAAHQWQQTFNKIMAKTYEQPKTDSVKVETVDEY